MESKSSYLQSLGTLQLLAILAVAGISGKIDLSGFLNTGSVGGVLLLFGMAACVVVFAVKSVKSSNNGKSKK